MNNFPHATTLVVGDWSDDGHGKTDVIIIHSNIESEKIMGAYRKASKKLGFKLIDDVCTDYEDSMLPTQDLKKLMDHGLRLEQIFEPGYDELEEAKRALENESSEGISLWPDSYAKIFLFIVGLGDPTFGYKIVEDDTSRINIGGYGLFE